VTKGQQYDRGGAYVVSVGRSVYSDLRSSYYADGRWSHGELVRSDDRAMVEAAVLRVIASGQAETVTIAEPKAAKIVVPQHPDTCPRCGTVCYGDCSTR